MASKKKFTGTSGADTINGTTGADVLAGLAGNDTYIVNHVDDEVVEKKNEGIDTVVASVSYVLPDHVENLTLAGNALIGGGNSLANVIAGNAGTNILASDGGDDVLTGGGGLDFLDGGAGFDAARYSGSFFGYSIGRLTLPASLAPLVPSDWRGASIYKIADLRDGAPDGTDYVRNVERLEFTDAVIYLDGRNNAPRARADALATDEDVPLTVQAATLLANDNDFDGDRLTLVSVGGAAHGTVALLNGAVTFTPDTDYNGDASFTYRVSDGRGGFADAAVSLAIAPVEDAISGTAQDGYIAGATVFRDTDGDGVLDATEESTLTDGGGHFTIGAGPGDLVMVGGTDIATNLPFAGVLRAPHGYSVITPLTALVAALADAGLPANQAEQRVLAAFGLDTSLNLKTFDPIAAARSEDPATSADGQDAFVAGTLALNLATMAGALLAGESGQGGQAETSSVFDAIARRIAALPAGQMLDLANATVVGAIVADAAGTPVHATIAGAAQVIADSNAAVNSAAQDAASAVDLLADVSQVSHVAQGEAADSLAAVGAGAIDIAVTQAQYTGAAMQAAIDDASGQTGDVDGPGINNAPIAAGDSLVLDEDTFAAFNVLQNDRDYDGDPLTILAVTTPSHGFLNVIGDGNFQYVPSTDYSGNDSFTYRVSDPSGAFAEATVDITVNAANDAPRATFAAEFSPYGVGFDSRATATVLLFAEDGSGVLYRRTGPGVIPGSLFFSGQGGSGTVTTFTPNSAIDISHGGYIFQGVPTGGSTEGGLWVRSFAAFTLTALPQGAAAPHLSDDGRYVGFTSAVDLAPGDANGVTDVFVENLASRSFEIASASSSGEVANAASALQWISSNGREVVFSSAATNLTAEGSGGLFRKHLDTGAIERIGDAGGKVLSDGHHALSSADGHTYIRNLDTGTVQEVTLGADLGVVGDWRFNFFHQTDGLYVYDKIGDVVAKLGNDSSSITVDPKTHRVVSKSVSNAGLRISEDGNALIVQTTSHDNTRSEPVLSNIRIIENPLLPQAQPFARLSVADADASDVVTAVLSVAHGTLTIGAGAGLQSASGSGSAAVTLVGLPDAINAAIGALVYTPQPGFVAREEVTVSVTDSAGATSSIVTPPFNHMPHANADAVSITENQSVTIDVLANDTDADAGAVLTLVDAGTVDGAGALVVGGQIVFDSGSAFDYLAQGATATALATYGLRDDKGVLAGGTITLTVTGQNDAPVAGEGRAVTQVDTAIAGVFTVSDVDAAPGELAYAITGDPVNGAVALTANGGYTYTPAAGYVGSDQFTFEATDAVGAKATGTVFVGIGTAAGTIVGTSGADSIIGSAGAEVIDGGAGADTIEGNGGADVLTGGPGSDRFVYSAPDADSDTITDLEAFSGGDVLDLRDLLVGYAGDAAAFVRLGGGVDGATLEINADGAGDDFVQLAVLQNVFGISLDGLIAQGNLVLA